MIYLMLYYLRHISTVGTVLRFKIAIKVVYLYFLISCALSDPIKGKAAFFRPIFTALLRDHRIDHCKLKWSRSHNDHRLVHSDHVRRHANAPLPIRPQGVKHIRNNLLVSLRRLLCFS